MTASLRSARPQLQCLQRLIPHPARATAPLRLRSSANANANAIAIASSNSNHARRAWYHHSSTVLQMAPRFAPGSDESLLTQQTQALVQAHGWALDAEEMGLRKTFHFKTYTKALDFLHVVGVRSKSRSHHATMTIKPSSVEVHWTTHVPRGLSSKDVDMARYCEEQATEIGTVEKGQGQNCHTGKSAAA